LFQVVMNQKEELEKAFYMMPIHSDLLDYWKENEETEPIKKALRFLFMSNLTYLNQGNSLIYGAVNTKKKFFDYLDFTFDFLQDVQFLNIDFRKLEKYLSAENESTTFIYCDPPYLTDRSDHYKNQFTESDSLDLFDCLEATGCKFAMSEFDHPFILEQAKERGLNVIVIGERQNLKNRRTEILVTNYENAQTTMF
jgi:DNA adenine methylase